MNILILAAANLAAIFLLTFGLYLRRHRRRDLAVSYLGINIGVFAVAASLSGSAASTGLGLGLFGVLSIIRLRSTELEQHEVAYYFSALALGLISGIGSTPLWLAPALMLLILAVMFVGDHPRVLPTYRNQTVVLDRALSREDELHVRLAEVVGGTVHSATVTMLDLVNDKTIVNVRYSSRSDAGLSLTPPPAAAHPVPASAVPATAAPVPAPASVPVPSVPFVPSVAAEADTANAADVAAVGSPEPAFPSRRS